MFDFRGAPVTLDGTHEPVAQWAGRNDRALEHDVHIQIGMLSDGRWYLRHLGFGAWSLPDKAAVWAEFKRFAEWHEETEWERIDVDEAPFLRLWRPDGSRVLYSTIEDSLAGCWGRHADALWDMFLEEMNRNTPRRKTYTHSLLGGAIELTTYLDPLDNSERHAVSIAIEAGTDLWGWWCQRAHVGGARRRP